VPTKDEQVPSEAIDIMVWDDSEGHQIVAAAISIKGREFLRSLTGEPDADSVSLHVPPEEFLSHVPPGMRVYFNKVDGTLVNLSGKKSLQ
jgi:hypothetical protein